MSEEIKKFNTSQDENLSSEENQSEKEDNRLPYESPKLRKHGKISDITATVTPGTPFDNPFFVTLRDFS